MNETVLSGKVVVITGAGRGIGKAIALGFARAGASVGCGSRTLVEVQRTVAKIQEHGGVGLATRVDVTNLAEVEAFVRQVATTFKGIDIAILNAGVSGELQKVEDSDPFRWRETVEVNLVGAYHSARAMIPYLKARGGGKIIVIGSGMGYRGMAGSSAYSCSKAGLGMLVQVLAEELREDAITVNELIPGPVNTTISAGVSLESEAFTVEWHKTPADVVPLALFLATQPSLGPTGQSFSLMRRLK